MATATKIKSAPIKITLRESYPSEVVSADQGEKIVSFVACEETPIERWDWLKGRYFLILSHDPDHVRLDRVESGACMFLEDHNSYDADKRIGKILSVAIADGKLKAEARLNSLEAGNRFYQEVVDRTEPPKSVGAAVYETEVVEAAVYEEDDDGDRKLIKPATLRAIDWELMEISSVSVPAIGSAATKEASNEQQYEMLMHGNPGMELDIPEIVVKASAPKTEEKPKTGAKPPSKPKSPSKKPMATLREKLADLEHDALIDRAVELHQSHESAKEQLEEAKTQLAQLTRKDAIRDQYFSLRHKAEGLLRKAQLSSHSFGKYFTESAIEDINALCKKDNAEIRLAAIEMFLEDCSESTPQLNTKLATDDEPLPERKTEQKRSTPTGQSTEEYAKSLLSGVLG